MFTGIVREVGRVVACEGGAEDGAVLVVHAPGTAASVAAGGSVSIDGVCLTVEEVRAGGQLRFHAVPETLSRTNLARLVPGEAVNVEPALRAGEPLGGHYVQGHVDGVGSVRSVVREGEGARMAVAAPAELLRYCVEKGSIAVDGVSLTIAALAADGFEVALIPHTLAATTLGELRPGRAVNLEVDVLAKYVERLVARDGGQAAATIRP
ncbi:MAG TPA: riboflavin synthase [Gaiellaceae bacterium]|nr:riboflavin synthase [Gaiellaceae bacterium]